MPTLLDMLGIGALKDPDEPAKVYSGILPDVALADAVEQVAAALGSRGERVVALLQGVTGFRFAVLQDKALCGRTGDPKDAAFLDTVYEARLFRETDSLERLAELRWLHEGGGMGQAVWVAIDPGDFETIVPIDTDEPCTAMIAASALHWGEVDRNLQCPHGWIALSEARVGRLWVPFRGPTPSNGERPRLLMRSIELIATEPEYGNCFVTEELIHGFQWA